MQKYINNVAVANGAGQLRAISGALITVTNLDGSAATIYDNNGGAPRTDPLLSDDKGYFAFYAADGRYTITITKVGITSISITDVLLEDPINGLESTYGADSTGASDSSAIISAALALYGQVEINKPGTYRCDEMIEISAGQVLILGPRVFLKRFSAFSASTDPVVWIKGSNATFKGSGQASSGVFTQNRAPKGVVRLGHKDMTESHTNVLYCTLADMIIGGGVDYGQTSGLPDVALYMPDPLIGSIANFFHNVRDLCVQDVNVGIWLQGDANANTIRGIQGVRIGNTTLPTANRNAFFVCQGALDNTISDCFLHASPNSIGIVVENLDNTATPGGSNHIQQTNSWKGMVFEQGGGAAVGLKALVDTGACHYEILSNVAGGDVVTPAFYDNNWLIGYGRSFNGFLALAGSQKIRAGLNTLGTTIMRERYLRLTGMAENTTYKAVTVNMPTNSTSALVVIEFSTNAGSGLDFQGAGRIAYEMRRSAAGVITASIQMVAYTGLCRPCIPEISGSDVILKFAVANNGTGTTSTSLGASVKVISTLTPTFHETLTTGVAGTVVPSGVQAGTFTASLTGCTAAVTGTAVWSIVNNIVNMTYPLLSGTSNTTAATITGAPSALFPAAIQYPQMLTIDNTVTGPGRGVVATNGVVTLNKLDSAVFTNVGTKGVPAVTFSYPLT